MTPFLWCAVIGCGILALSLVLDGLMDGLDGFLFDGSLPVIATALGVFGAVGAVTDVMTRGNLGRARIPGKHGGAPRRYTEVQVLVPDAAGELGRLFSDIGAAGVNIEDFSLEHSAGQSAGIALISVLPAAAQRLEEALDAQGWRVVAG